MGCAPVKGFIDTIFGNYKALVKFKSTEVGVVEGKPINEKCDGFVVPIFQRGAGVETSVLELDDDAKAKVAGELGKLYTDEVKGAPNAKYVKSSGLSDKIEGVLFVHMKEMTANDTEADIAKKISESVANLLAEANLSKLEAIVIPKLFKEDANIKAKPEVIATQMFHTCHKNVSEPFSVKKLIFVSNDSAYAKILAEKLETCAKEVEKEEQAKKTKEEVATK